MSREVKYAFRPSRSQPAGHGGRGPRSRSRCLRALAVQRMPVDIFPKVGDPAIYVAQPYGGWTRLRWKAT